MTEIAENLSGQVIKCRKERLGLPTSDEEYQAIYSALVLNNPDEVISMTERYIAYKQEKIMTEQKSENQKQGTDSH